MARGGHRGVASRHREGGVSDPGGGASRSTDPAAGSSAATDVSLREYVMAAIGSMDRHLTAELAALRRETVSAQANAKEAVGLASEEAKERLASHNGLIDQMQQLSGTFVTREILDTQRDANDERIKRIESWQARMTGALVLVSVIGVANLVKLWAG